MNLDELNDEATVQQARELFSTGIVLRGTADAPGVQGKALDVIAFLLGENDAVMGKVDPGVVASNLVAPFAAIPGTISRDSLIAFASMSTDDFDDIRLGRFVPDGQSKPYPTRQDYLRGRTVGYVRVLGLLSGFFDVDSRFEREYLLATGEEYDSASAIWDTGAQLIEDGAAVLGFSVDTDMGADGFGGTQAQGSGFMDSAAAVLQSETAQGIISAAAEYALQ